MPNSISIDNIGKISKLEYVVMFLMLCISGNPIFIYAESKFIYAIFAVLMLGLCIIKGKRLSNSNFMFWLICSCLLFLFQRIALEQTSINADLNFIVRLYIAYLSASFFGYKFREVYFKVMVMVCLISIPCYLLQVGGVTFGFQFDRYYTIGFFNSIISRIDHGNIRNSGMFWEPGAFQGFIMLIPLLYSNKLKYLWNFHKKECIILLIVFITTQSTTGYITFITFILLTIILNGKMNVVLKSLIVMLIFALLSFVWSQDFMGEKITEQYNEALAIQQGDVSWNRMGAMVIDIGNIARHPIIGNGFMDASRYGVLGEYMRGTGNGFSGAINMFGIPFMLLYFIKIFQNATYMTKNNRIVYVFIIILLLNGEYFLNYHLFWSLLFIKVPLTPLGQNDSIHMHRNLDARLSN